MHNLFKLFAHYKTGIMLKFRHLKFYANDTIYAFFSRRLLCVYIGAFNFLMNGHFPHRVFFCLRLSAVKCWIKERKKNRVLLCFVYFSFNGALIFKFKRGYLTFKKYFFLYGMFTRWYASYIILFAIYIRCSPILSIKI